MLNDWKPDTAAILVSVQTLADSQARITELESAVRQAVMELREASNILTDKDMPSTAKLFAVAAERKAKLLGVSHG